MPLAGKHIIITGAAGALGVAVADRALELGARLTLVDLVAGRAGAEERWLSVDLTDGTATGDALASIPEPDALFHLVGGFTAGEPGWTGPSPAWEQMHRINVVTLQTMLAAVVPRMRARGRGAIVAVGALSALSGRPGMSAYCAAKSAVMRLVESVAAELRDDGVNVNAVLPGIIDTSANRKAMPGEDSARWVAPRELADVICFLASESACAIRGALIPVAGRAG